MRLRKGMEAEKLISSMLQSFSKHKIKEALTKVVVGIENREVEVEYRIY